MFVPDRATYGESRYVMDAELFRHRVLVGSETFPTMIGKLWPMVLAGGSGQVSHRQWVMRVQPASMRLGSVSVAPSCWVRPVEAWKMSM